MTYNPYSDEHNRIESVISEKIKIKNLLHENIKTFDNLNIKRLIIISEMYEKEKNNLIFRNNKLKSDIIKINNKLIEINKKIKNILNPLYWFDLDQDIIKLNFESLKREKIFKQYIYEQDKRFISNAENFLIDNKKIIDSFKNFDREKSIEKLNFLSIEIDLLKNDLDIVTSIKKRIDFELNPIIEQISIYELTISNDKEKLEIAKSFDQMLSCAKNSFERLNVHKECEKFFGDGSPKKVLKQQEFLIKINQKNLEKTKKRALKIGIMLSRNIKKIVIDGNNMCYEGSVFVGINPLLIMTEYFYNEFEIIVIFDSAIRAQLKSNDNTIKSLFCDGVKIHIVATRQLADETILNIASNDISCYILRNDRFGEYREKEAVKNNRLIRHEIVDKRVMIHDLNFSARYD